MSARRFILENARVIRLHALDKVTFVTLLTHGFKVGTYDYTDVTCFGAFREHVALGAAVTMTGDIQGKKPKGSERWGVEFIGREVESVSDELVPAMPAPRAPVEQSPVADEEIPF